MISPGFHLSPFQFLLCFDPICDAVCQYFFHQLLSCSFLWIQSSLLDRLLGVEQHEVDCWNKSEERKDQLLDHIVFMVELHGGRFEDLTTFTELKHFQPSIYFTRNGTFAHTHECKGHQLRKNGRKVWQIQSECVQEYPERTICFQNSGGSLNPATHNAYHTSLLPSLLFEPRHPSSILNTHTHILTETLR